MGIKDVSSKVLRRVIRSADPDGSGDIDLSELARVLNRPTNRSSSTKGTVKPLLFCLYCIT
jgi:hypothetical protein